MGKAPYTNICQFIISWFGHKKVKFRYSRKNNLKVMLIQEALEDN